jgi:uncharacterized protein YukE
MRSHSGKVSAILLAAALAAGTLSSCVTPALDSGAFVENGKNALDSAISATASATLALNARVNGDATRAFSDVVVTDSEKAIAPIENSFGSVDPPSDADDQLRTSVLQAVGDAGDALSSARIAIRRDDPDAMRQAVEDLDGASQQLKTLRESLG